MGHNYIDWLLLIVYVICLFIAFIIDLFIMIPMMMLMIIVKFVWGVPFFVLFSEYGLPCTRMLSE